MSNKDKAKLAAAFADADEARSAMQLAQREAALFAEILREKGVSEQELDDMRAVCKAAHDEHCHHMGITTAIAQMRHMAKDFAEMAD